MVQSIVTSKGQTTIPKKIREFLKINPNDRLFYLLEDGKVILRPIQGNILELRGSVPAKGETGDFEDIRESVRKAMAKKIAEEDR